MWQDLFETEVTLKSIFLKVMYEKGLNDIWKILYRRKEWINVLRKEKQILKGINRIRPITVSWLDLVNLYGYFIGEHVYHAQRFGRAEKLSQLPGNHPHQLWHTLKGFDVTIQRGGHLTSYYTTYAIEGIATFAYGALRSKNIATKSRRMLLKQLNQPMNPQESILNERQAIQEIRSLEETLKKTKNVLAGTNLCSIIKHVRKIVLNLFPAVKNLIYTTYAEIDKQHDMMTKRMSNRFLYGPIISPDFKVNSKGEITGKVFPFYNYQKEVLEPEKEILRFINTYILPEIKNEDNKKLIWR